MRREGHPIPCGICGGRDARDAAHAAGCPALEPATKAQLLRLAVMLEKNWARMAQARPAARQAAEWRRSA